MAIHVHIKKRRTTDSDNDVRDAKHNLKNALAKAASFADILADAFSDIEDQTGKQNARKIRSEIERISSSIR